MMRIIRGAEIEYQPASHEDPKDPGVLKKVLLRRGELQTGSIQMLNWSLLPIGKSFKPHFHQDMEEVFIIFTGQAEMIAGEDKVTLEAGDTAIIPPQTVHEMKNVGSSDVVYLVFGISPNGSGKTINV